jgi:hypothetical protein
MKACYSYLTHQTAIRQALGMMVYRYLSEQYGLQALQTRRWKVGRILELNDPIDCQPTLVNAPGQISDDAHNAFARNYLSGIYDNMGIMCFSAQVTDPVIWTHYAEGHRGIALGFDIPNGQNLHKVTYPEDNRRMPLNYEELQGLRGTDKSDAAALEKILSDGFTVKAKSWSYEQEYRRFANLSQCKMIGPHYFHGLPLQHLRRVVIGVRSSITVADVRQIRRSWPVRNAAQVIKASISRDTYVLNA